MSHTVSPRKRGRPPKSGRDFQDTRELLCRAGMAAFTEKGFSALGIDEIVTSVGVPKGSFYHFFASKEAFGIEVIQRYKAYFARKLDQHLLDTRVTPLQRVMAFCRDAESGMAKFDYRRGCLVGNLGQEMGTLPASFRALLIEVLNDWQHRTEHCLLAAKAAGEISPDADCARWSSFFWIGWEGAVLRAKLECRGEPLQTFARLFQEMLPRQ